VRWRKKQYACKERLCKPKAFTGQIAEVLARARVTGRLRRAAGAAVGAGVGGTAVSAVGALFGLGWPTVHSAFVVHADAQLVGAPGPVVVLGIDETRRGRPTWSQDPPDAAGGAGLSCCQTTFVDLTGGPGLLGQTAGRTKKGVVNLGMPSDSSYRRHRIGTSGLGQIHS